MAQEIVVPQTEQPKTLENFLKKRFPIGYVRKLFRKNGVRLNGKHSGPNEIARPGDLIQLFIPFEERATMGTGKIPSRPGFEILFEDEDFLVINKAAGLAVQGGKDILQRHSLLGMLEATYSPKGTFPKPVHRLDRETSGLLVVAKSDAVAQRLEKKFAAGEVVKEYCALVKGRLRPKQGRIDFPLPGRDGKPAQALTFYRVDKEYAKTTLVRLRTETGRMHQIRRHLARLGHPVVLDGRYGDFAFNRQFRKEYGLKRQFLHAQAIAFEHGGTRWKWTAPLPDDLARTLESLESRRG